MRRAERKAAEVAAEQAQADAEQEKADRLFNKNARREQMADLKGRIARERREAQLRAERKAAERRVSFDFIFSFTCPLGNVSRMYNRRGTPSSVG